MNKELDDNRSEQINENVTSSSSSERFTYTYDAEEDQFHDNSEFVDEVDRMNRNRGKLQVTQVKLLGT